ncbi:MAG TPA: 4Fe-4S binding protein, partial [Anaerolineales bacterium]|nr:4Fe-4S binding protein [Anaerolineales bacterium]
RKGIVLLTFLSFPLTMNFLSPYVIVDGAAQGIVNGSLIMFGLMFLSALVFGRAWCGWVCPGAGMQEIVESVNIQPVSKKVDWIKWAIWIPWVSLIVWLAIRAGGYSRVDFLHLTETGISVDDSRKYVIYYGVVLIFVGLAAFVGRRAGCHTICWMAPFMMIGRWIRNRFGWASLRLVADSSACSDCKLCNKHCSMSLEVSAMALSGNMENSECILCGACVDHCARKAIRYSFSGSK